MVIRSNVRLCFGQGLSILYALGVLSLALAPVAKTPAQESSAPVLIQPSVQVSFPTLQGHTYQVLASTDPNAPEPWKPFGPALLAPGTNITFFFNTISNQTLFFRVDSISVASSPLADPTDWLSPLTELSNRLEVLTTSYQQYTNDTAVSSSDRFVSKSDLNDAWIRNIGAVPAALDPSLIELPGHLYVAPGRELNVYYDNILAEQEFPPDVEVRIDCPKGSSLARCWRYTPNSGDVGEYPFTVNVWWRGRRLVSKTCLLEVAALQGGSGIQRDVLIVGDSLTSDGEYPAETLRLFSGDPMVVRFLGTQGTAPVLHEGIPGWAASYFVERQTSPFVFGGKLDLKAYFEKNGMQPNSDTWMVFHLGVNDWALLDESRAPQASDEMVASLKQLIRAGQLALPSIRFVVLLPPPPAGSQDANAGNAYRPYRRLNARCRSIFVRKLIKTFDCDGPTWVADTGASVDTQYGYSTVTENVANRIPVRYTHLHDPVHPNQGGNYQIADGLYSFLKCLH